MAYYTHLVPCCGTTIETTITDKASVAENWVIYISSKFMINGRNIIAGLNCKWKSRPIRSMSSKIATLQLCVDTKCPVFQFLYMNGMPQSIKSFLSDSNVIVVGIEIRKTLFKLQNEYGLNCANKIDVRSLIKVNFPPSFYWKPGLKTLDNRIVGLHKWRPSDDECLKNMDSRFLGVEQVKFACIDAYDLNRISHKFLIEM